MLGGPKLEAFSFTLSLGMEQNPYLEELAAMAYALGSLPVVRYRSVVTITSNKTRGVQSA
jgi:hypothetical protein